MSGGSQSLANCNSDFGGNQKIDSKDAIIMYGLVEFFSTSSTQSFEDFFAGLVSSGQVPAIDVSSISTSDFLSSAVCYDYDISSSVTLDDVDILATFAGYMDKLVKNKIDETDASKFRLFIDTLEVQGLWESANFAGGGDQAPPIMLPTLPTDDKVYYTDDTWVPKVDDDDVAYDESNSEEGREVVCRGSNFLVSDPGVKTYYKWDGTSSTWLNTGLCKIFTRNGSELEESAIIHPPVDIIKNRTLPTSILPMGVPTAFNGKTIATSGQYHAVSWHYDSSGVVYVYTTSAGPDDHALACEILVPGDFSAGLPCIELNASGGLKLFVSNPLDTDDHKIQVYDLSTIPSGSTTVIDAPGDTTIESTSSASFDGFASSMLVSDDGNRLFVGSPLHITEKLGNIDHYNTGMIDYECGAVFVYKKNSSSGVWGLEQTIIPHDLDTYISNDYDSGSTVDLQFGYSVEASGTKLFIGAPRAYASSDTRREGAVYVYNLTSNEYVHQSTIRHDDAKFDTTSILDGNFNFGISVVSTENTDAISVLHHIPGQGTRVTKYSLSGSEYIMATTNSYHTISNQILTGMLAIGSDDVSVVYGSKNLLKLLV